eukprot:TRINITY_DN25663_c0_g1_i1.p1 TRINITY_DN25663_c0_g1~~TRINITY_DN25663_c0_g1_i1.p1  ORF type:complete len:132 (+),score=35.35 TRINITY_DN25663_c0_g1_i1:57-452(+)
MARPTSRSPSPSGRASKALPLYLAATGFPASGQEAIRVEATYHQEFPPLPDKSKQMSAEELLAWKRWRAAQLKKIAAMEKAKKAIGEDLDQLLKDVHKMQNKQTAMLEKVEAEVALIPKDDLSAQRLEMEP